MHIKKYTESFQRRLESDMLRLFTISFAFLEDSEFTYNLVCLTTEPWTLPIQVFHSVLTIVPYFKFQ